jgi:hypothetical protein
MRRVLVTWAYAAVVLVVACVYAVKVGAPWYAGQLAVIGCAIPIARALWAMRKAGD